MAEPGPLGPRVLEAALAGTALCCSEQRLASTRLSLALPLRPHLGRSRFLEIRTQPLSTRPCLGLPYHLYPQAAPK